MAKRLVKNNGREGFNSGQEGFHQAKGYTEEEVKKLYSCVTDGIPGVKAVESTLTRSSSASAHLGVAHEDITPAALQDPGSKLSMHLHRVHDEARREAEQSAALQQQYLAQVEAEILNSVGMLHHVFSRSDFGAINADGTPVDHLGHHVAANLGFVMGDAQEKFRKALEEMGKVKFGVTMTRIMSFEAGVKVSNGLFRHGDLMDMVDPGGKMKRGFEAMTEIGIPSVPIVSVYAGIDIGYELPYFFRADAAGEYAFKVEVENKAFFGILDGKAGSKMYEPVITVNNEISGSVAASLQVGASAQLRECTTGICVLFVCTGPRLSFRQDVYVGFDVLAGAAALDKDCVEGPTQLATTFTDWDYHQADKDRCQLKKDGSFLLGGYMQIPRLAVSLVMTTSLGVDGPGADAPWKDYEIEKMMYGEDGDPYVFLGALFDPICEGGGSSAVLKTCDADVEQSALGGLPQCAYDTRMTVAKNVAALSDTSAAGSFGDFEKVKGPGPALPPAPSPPPSPPPPSPPPPPPPPSPSVVPFSSKVISFDKHLHIKAGSWINTQIDARDLGFGSYLVRIDNFDSAQFGGGQWSESYSGLMTWYNKITNSGDTCKVELTQSGHAANGRHVLLQTKEYSVTQQHGIGFDLWSNEGTTRAMPVHFKFRQVMPDPGAERPGGKVAPKNEVDNLSYFPVVADLKTTGEGLWTDTGIERDDLFSGTYFVQVQCVSTAGNGGGLYEETFTGLMSWYSTITNGYNGVDAESDEISLHHTGHAANGCKVMLCTQRRTWNVGRGGLALQMATKCQHGSGTTHAFRYDFFFRLAIPASLPTSAVVYGDHQPSPGLDEFKTLDMHFRIRNQWTNVPVSAGALATGTYLVQFKNVDIHAVGVYAETFSAVMSWRSGGTNANDASELVNFHSAGHARNNVKFKLRFKESGWQGPWEGLQIWCSHDTPAAQVYTVVFKRMI